MITSLKIAFALVATYATLKPAETNRVVSEIDAPSETSQSTSAGTAQSGLRPWIPEIPVGYPVRDPWKNNGPLTPDYGKQNSAQVVESMQDVFRAVKGTKVLPNVDIKKQHTAYQQKVDQVIAALPYKPNKTHINLLRSTADATVFMATFRYDINVPAGKYYKIINAQNGDTDIPGSGKDLYESGVAQKIVDNGSRGICADAVRLYMSLNHLSGMNPIMNGVLSRKYGVSTPLVDNHAVVQDVVDARQEGKRAVYYSDPTSAAMPDADWSKINRMPHPEAWFVGAKGDDVLRAYYLFTRLPTTHPDLIPAVFESLPSYKEMALAGSLPGLDAIAKEIEILNKEIRRGR